LPGIASTSSLNWLSAQLFGAMAMVAASARIQRHRIFNEAGVDLCDVRGARCRIGLLQQIQEAACIAIGKTDQRVDRHLFEFEAVQRFLLGLGQQLAHFFVAQRLQHIDLRARQQCGIDFETGILGGGADEGYQAGFDERQQGILLRLVEAVDLVHEQDGMAAILVEILLRLLHRGADILHAGKHGGQGDKRGIESVRGKAGQRGLADARRPPQDHRMRFACLKREPQWLAFAQQMALADHFVQGLGAQRLSQRLAGLCGE
jgi:hypothetical protein